jgi:hypothetical protein
MEKINRLLNEHKQEFLEMVENLYDEKYPSKKGKTLCMFKVAGRHYKSNIFTKNYRAFLSDLTTSMGPKAFKKVMGRYVEFNPNDFPKSVLQRGQYEQINDSFYLSTYSSTEIKISHIVDLCEFLDIPLELEYPKTYYTAIARELGIIR